MPNVKIEISARHIHVTREDLEVLFGEGFVLEKENNLSQKGEFASTAKVTLQGEKGKIENVRIIGPCRTGTQIEVSRTDAIKLGSKAPLRLSGKLVGSGAVKLIGQKGELELEDGVIVAKRHLHLSDEEALHYGIKNGQNVSVEIEGERGLIFNKVEARVADNYSMSVHIDTDEANAAGVTEETEGELIIK